MVAELAGRFATAVTLRFNVDGALVVLVTLHFG